MSLLAYTNPTDPTTQITAQAYAKLPYHDRNKVFCGGRNRQGDICMCPMHFRSASSYQQACFVADDADRHIRGCPNCLDVKRKTISIAIDDAKVPLDDLYKKMSKPAKDTATKKKPNPPVTIDTILSIDDDNMDRRETVIAETRLPRNARELYNYLLDNWDQSNPDNPFDEIILDADTVGNHWPENLDGRRLVILDKPKHFYKFPHWNNLSNRYEQGDFLLLLRLDGTDNVMIRINIKNHKQAIKLKNDLYKMDKAKLVAFLELKYVGPDQGQHLYDAKVTGRNQIAILK